MFPKTKKENGFTIAELLVVVGVISVILCIVVGARYNTAHKQEQGNLKDKAASSKEGSGKGTQSVTINQQADNVAKMVKENPIAYQEFLQKMVDIACRNNPGLALQIEQYATVETQRRMEQLSKDASVAKLTEQKAEIDALTVQVGKLKVEKEGLATKLASANSEYNNLRKSISKDPKDGVPVLTTSTWLTQWAHIKIFKVGKTNADPWEFSVGPGKTIVHLPPGNYVYDIYAIYEAGDSKRTKTNKLFKGQLYMTVDDKPSYGASGDGYYYGHIEIGT